MSEQYAQQWQHYRRLHWAAALGLLLGLPASAVLARVVLALTGFDVIAVLLPITALWAVFWLWLCLRVTRFPCPRCSRAFLASQELSLAKTRYCSNCGLQLYRREP